MEIFIECRDDAEGFPYVKISIQWTASYNGQGLYSSVQPFQNAHHETEASPMDIDPPETDDNLPARDVVPPGSFTEGEIQMEVQE